jgi:hypothetical protein
LQIANCKLRVPLQNNGRIRLAKHIPVAAALHDAACAYRPLAMGVETLYIH